MKVRKNFVSNSSSSSYIIGIALVKDDYLDQVKNFMFISDANLELLQGRDEYINESSFNYDEVVMKVPKGRYALKFSDYIDCEVNEDGEPIESASLEDFNSSIQKIFSEEMKDWFDEVVFEIGSGYNG